MYKLNDFDLLIFLRQFRVLLSSGYSIADSLDLISKHISGSRFKTYLLSAHQDLKSGESLYDALFGRDHPFPESMARCFQSMPQRDHQLELTIRSLEENYRIRTELVQSPFSLVPRIGVTLLCALLLIFIFFVGVIPMFEGIFSGFGQGLPALTQFFFDVSLFVRRYWFLVLLIIAAVYYLILSKKVKLGFNDADLYYIFSLMLGQLKSSANIKQMLSWAGDSLDNRRLEKRLHSVLRGVENGKTLSESFRHATYFPLFVTDVIALAEKKGDLKPAMEEIVSYYSIKKEWDLRVRIGPIIAVIFLIAIIIVTLYLPIFQMAAVIG